MAPYVPSGMEDFPFDFHNSSGGSSGRAKASSLDAFEGQSGFPPPQWTSSQRDDAYSPDSPRSAGSASLEWNIDEAFSDALQRAHDEGLNLFAAAPLPSYRESARNRSKPKLQAPHIKSSGLVKQESDISRLDTCLTRDFFVRPGWNHSTLPRKVKEDSRSLETIARDRRETAMKTILRREEAGSRPSTSMHCRPSRGIVSSDKADAYVGVLRPGTSPPNCGGVRDVPAGRRPSACGI